MKNIKNNRGFTIVEVTVVVLIIGILASVIVVGYGAWRKNVITGVVKSDLTQAVAAMESHRNFNNGYPETIPRSFVASEYITVTGGGSASGKSFCINASSIESPDIVFNVTHENKTPQPGTCVLKNDQSPTETIFVANGTWTKPSGAKKVDVLVIGGGGNGGPCGGAGGGVRTATIDASTVPETVTVSVATAGSGASSSFGALVVAGGGQAGAGCSAVGGSGGGTSSVYGNGANGGNAGEAGITGGGGWGGTFHLAGADGAIGTYGGGGGGGGSFEFCSMAGKGASVGGSDGITGCTSDGRGGGGGDGGGYGGGGGGNGEGSLDPPGNGAPGVVKVTVSYN